MKPHPTYRAAWFALHILGVVACHGFGWWGEYFTAVAFLEGVALVRKIAKGRPASGTWSWVVWWGLEDRGPAWRGTVLTGLVALWSVWFSVGFMLHGWFPWPAANVVVGMGFLGWVWRHFFERLARVGAARIRRHKHGPHQ